MGRRWLWILLALAAFASACSSGTDLEGALVGNSPDQEAIDDADDSVEQVEQIEPEPDVPDVPGAPLNRFELQVGQCFNEGSWYDEELDRRIDLTASTSCEGDHQGEVYHEAEFPAPNGALFPGDDTLSEWSTQVCYNAFSEFVDAEYEVSSLEIGVVQPTRQTFEDEVGRHRRVFCYVFDPSGQDSVGSAEGSGL